MGNFLERENQYIQIVNGLYYKLPTNSKQLPDFWLELRSEIQTLISEEEGKCVTIGSVKIYPPVYVIINSY